MSHFIYIGANDPIEHPPLLEEREYYSLATDTLWHFYNMEDGGAMWMLGLTNASQFDADCAHIRSLGQPPEIFDIPIVVTRLETLN